MAPLEVVADPLPRSDEIPFRRRLPETSTVVRLLHGACSCDLVIERDPDGTSDEAHLRGRYFRQRLPRDRVIAAIDRHRRARECRRRPLAHWQNALTSFVAEHARNAGPTLYLLDFDAGREIGAVPEDAPLAAAVEQVRAQPGRWLPEGRLVLVER